MAHEYRTTRRVEFADTDMAGIIHFATYYNYMEEVEHEFLRSLGLSVMMETDDGHIGWPRVKTQCEYSRPVRFEDEVEAHLVVRRKGTKSITYRITFSHNGDEIAIGESTAVCCLVRPGQKVESIPIPAIINDRIETAPN